MLFFHSYVGLPEGKPPFSHIFPKKTPISVRFTLGPSWIGPGPGGLAPAPGCLVRAVAEQVPLRGAMVKSGQRFGTWEFHADSW